MACIRKLLTMLNATLRDQRPWSPPLLARPAETAYEGNTCYPMALDSIWALRRSAEP